MTVKIEEGRATYICPKCGSKSCNPHDVEHWYCGNCHVFAEQLRDEIVTELDLTGIEEKNWPRRCDCFTCAILAQFQTSNPSATLVHGWVRDSWRKSNSPEYVLHAWVEMLATGIYEDGSRGPVMVVVDLTQLHKGARILPRDQYYREAGVAAHLPIKRFTRVQATLLAIQHGNDGPWGHSTLSS